MALPNPGMDAVPFTPLTAEFLDDMIENIESLSSGTGIGDGSITASKIDSASFPGITTQANTGSAGGTMTLISIGNLRIAYGASASKSSGASPHDPKAYTVIFPSGFLS